MFIYSSIAYVRSNISCSVLRDTDNRNQERDHRGVTPVPENNKGRQRWGQVGDTHIIAVAGFIQFSVSCDEHSAGQSEGGRVTQRR